MRRGKMIMIAVLVIVLLIVVIGGIDFYSVKKLAEERFSNYESRVKTIETTYGKMSYMDEGTGEPVLICHGICGGYDQGFDTLADCRDAYRVIAPSRFGYPGSDMPENATIEMQVGAYKELLDALEIDKIYILATSAGSTSAIKFALMHPERTKGLILYCSGYPGMEAPQKKVIYAAPPEMLCNDFCMWLISPFFEPIMGMERATIKTIIPMKERKAGIVFDGKMTNTVMINDYKSYDMSQLQVPVLMIHSKDDKMSDFTKAKDWVDKIPDCTTLFFETGGHLMTGNGIKTEKALEKFVK